MAECGDTVSIIVNTSAIVQRVAELPLVKSMGVYAASKAGGEMLLKYAAVEVSHLSFLVSSKVVFIFCCL